jgi:hypothetical protein
MKLSKKIGLVLGLGAFGLSATASAITHTGGGSVTRVNTAGSTWLEFGPVATQFCYLNKVSVENGDAVDETTACLLFPNAGTWVLGARIGKTGDAVVSCEARCYTTN